MKNLVNSCLLGLAMLAFHPINAQLSIQEFSFAKLAKKNTIVESDATVASTTAKPAASFYRQHKELPSKYSGFAIELTRSDLPLKTDYFLFKQFGSVYYHRLKEEGYSYCIIAKFSNKKSAEKFLQQVILPNAPEAKLIKYKKGIRKN